MAGQNGKISRSTGSCHCQNKYICCYKNGSAIKCTGAFCKSLLWHFKGNKNEKAWQCSRCILLIFKTAIFEQKTRSMNLPELQMPGVYIQESEGFPNSVVGVATAVPAFIGYTPQASYQGKSYMNVPVKITSFADSIPFFCLPAEPLPADPPKQYNPECYLIQQNSEAATGHTIMISGDRYSIVPDPATLYYLYNSVKMFMEMAVVMLILSLSALTGPHPGNLLYQVFRQSTRMLN